MKKFYSLVLAILFVFVVCIAGCATKENPKAEVILNNVISDLVKYQEKNTRSMNTENYLYGIYICDTSPDYYSINKLGLMTFEERVNLLDGLEAAKDSSYVVIENKAKLFYNYISIDDIIKNGISTSTVIDIYLPVNNIETGTQTYPNGTTLKRVFVQTNPTKTDYLFGDTLDITGLIVKGEYLDGTFKTETVTISDCSNFNSKVVGSNIITVTILGRTTSFTVNIGNVITDSTFTLIRRIDILKLKQYSATFKVSDKTIDTIVLTANGGIKPNVATITNGIGSIPSITLDDFVTTITIRALSGGKQIGIDKTINL